MMTENQRLGLVDIMLWDIDHQQDLARFDGALKGIQIVIVFVARHQGANHGTETCTGSRSDHKGTTTQYEAGRGKGHRQQTTEDPGGTAESGTDFDTMQQLGLLQDAGFRQIIQWLLDAGNHVKVPLRHTGLFEFLNDGMAGCHIGCKEKKPAHFAFPHSKCNTETPIRGMFSLWSN